MSRPGITVVYLYFCPGKYIGFQTSNCAHGKSVKNGATRSNGDEEGKGGRLTPRGRLLHSCDRSGAVSLPLCVFFLAPDRTIAFTEIYIRKIKSLFLFLTTAMIPFIARGCG